ncbi:MAG: hypothetical protein ACPG5Z_08550 [Pseudoalteromonas sp.]
MRPIERIAQLHALGKKYAKAKAECEHLKHFRKSKLAMLKAQYLADDSKRSNAACDDLARSHPEYIEVLNGLKESIEVSEAALWELKTSHAGINIWQTQRADERAELKMQNDLT